MIAEIFDNKKSAGMKKNIYEKIAKRIKASY